MIDVVAALIWEHADSGVDRFMICRRPRNKARGLLWEFVGGKVEPGETKEQALIRECREELAVTVAVGEIFAEVIHEYPDITIKLTLYNCIIDNGIPTLLEHSGLRWIKPEEIHLYDFCPADTQILQRIIDKTNRDISSMETERMENMDEVFEFLKACRTYYLATVENDQPRVRPFGTVDKFNNHLYIQTGRIKSVSIQMHLNPKIEICAFDGSKWLRVEATAVSEDNLEAEKHMLATYPELSDMYQPGDGNNEVFRLENVTATFASFGEPEKTIKF